MKKPHLFAVLSFAVLLGAALAVTSSNAASCKWGQIAVGCDGNCLVLAFSNPGANCPGTTVDLQRSDCGIGNWTTIATNVTSPVTAECNATGEYRLVANCGCGGTLTSQSTGCQTCP